MVALFRSTTASEKRARADARLAGVSNLLLLHFLTGYSSHKLFKDRRDI